MNKIDKSIYENLILLPYNLTGWNGESTVFHQLIDEVKPKIIFEVGSWLGLSAINMGNYCRKQNYETKIWCVDTWLGSEEMLTWLEDTPERNLFRKNGYPQIYFQFLSNVVHHSLQDYILPLPNTSLIGAKYFAYNNIKADMIYIDADHSHEGCYEDIKAYWPLLEQGGIMVGDDVVAWSGVKTAVDQFTQENNLTFEVLENNFWVIRK